MTIVRAITPTAVFSAVINILMLTGPLFMLQVYDRVLTSASVPTLVALVTIVTALYAFLAALEWIRSRVLSRLAHQLDEELAYNIFRTVLTEDKNSAARTRIFSPLRDLDTVRNFIAGQGPRALLDAPWVPIYIAVIFVLHSLLGWFAVGSALLLVALMLATRYAVQNGHAESAGYQEAAHAIEQEARGQSDLVRALGMHEGLSRKWGEIHARALSTQQTANDRSSFFSSVTKSARLFLQAGILAIGAWLAIHHEITAGAIIASAIILSRGLSPVEQLLSSWQSITAAYAAWQRLAPLANTPAAPKTRLPAPAGKLSVEGLSCFVPGTPEPLLTNVTFKLEPGEILGIVGPSGVGKSTLLKALLGIWPHARGEVRLDGATLNQWDRPELARHLGYVPQDITLFSGTVAQNISRFLPDASSEQIVEAAKLAQAHEMILGLPFGYDTPVGPKGVTISAGQRQRIALASALYGRPRLIVLDEPNSNLDEAGERALIDALKAMRDLGSTIIIATHRPAALANAGKLLALRENRQASFGNKDQARQVANASRFPVVLGGAPA